MRTPEQLSKSSSVTSKNTQLTQLAKHCPEVNQLTTHERHSNIIHKIWMNL